MFPQRRPTTSATRTSVTWIPPRPWDWFYGPGYWWYGYDYPWYPGWNKWAGCHRPTPWWWHGTSHTPPEVVAERELEIGPDGTVAEPGTLQAAPADVIACATATLQRWSFAAPPRGEPLVVEAPLTFTAYQGPARALCPEQFAVVDSDGNLRE